MISDMSMLWHNIDISDGSWVEGRGGGGGRGVFRDIRCKVLNIADLFCLHGNIRPGKQLFNSFFFAD